MICSGDAGVYGMAGLMYEVGAGYPDTELQIIAGVTAANAGAAVLGAPLIHAFLSHQLSDLLTPWEKIEKRLRLASEADFSIVLYNPSSKKERTISKRHVILCWNPNLRKRSAGSYSISAEKGKAAGS